MNIYPLQPRVLENKICLLLRSARIMDNPSDTSSLFNLNFFETIGGKYSGGKLNLKYSVDLLLLERISLHTTAEAMGLTFVHT